MSRRPVGPLRRLLFTNSSDDSSEEDEDSFSEEQLDELERRVAQELTDEGWIKIEDPYESTNDIEHAVLKWKERINEEGVERRMMHNYIKAYTDLSDEEIEERLDDIL